MVIKILSKLKEKNNIKLYMKCLMFQKNKDLGNGGQFDGSKL